jgi:hypothetical protein
MGRPRTRRWGDKSHQPARAEIEIKFKSFTVKTEDVKGRPFTGLAAARGRDGGRARRPPVRRRDHTTFMPLRHVWLFVMRPGVRLESRQVRFEHEARLIGG